MNDKSDTLNSKLFAIMRVGKIENMTVLRHVSNHNTRVVSSENVDSNGPPIVELLELGSDDFVASARQLMAELDIDPATAKSKNVAVEAVVSASRDWFQQATPEAIDEWKAASVGWAKKLFGRGLISAKLHEDEEVPHIHFVAVPVVQKRRLRRGPKPKDPEARRQRELEDAEAPLIWTLSYHDVLGGKSDRLSVEQDNYYACVAHLGLRRGIKNPEVTNIELGDELTIAVTAYARGENSEGAQLPRRNIPPKEYRALLKRALAEAELARDAQQKEQDIATELRMLTESERELARVALLEALAAQNAAEAAVGALALQSNQLLIQAEVDRQEADIRQAELDRAEHALEAKALEQQRQIDRDREELERLAAFIQNATAEAEAEKIAAAAREAELERQRLALEAERENIARDRAIAETAATAAEKLMQRAKTDHAHADAMMRASAETQAEAQQAMKLAEAIRMQASRDAENATHDLIAAKTELSRASELREAAEQEQKRIDQERQMQTTQLALIERASDDSSGLHLRIGQHPTHDAGFIMNTDKMGRDELASYHAPWHPLIVAIAKGVVRMLEAARKMTATLLRREEVIATRETRLSDSERNMADQRLALKAERESMSADHQKRSAILAVAETAADIRTKEAAARERAAAEKISEAEEARRSDVRWIQAVNLIAKKPTVITVDIDGEAKLDEEVAKTLGAAFMNTFAAPPPDWAAEVLTKQLTLAERVHATQLRENEAAANVIELRDLIKMVDATLTPEQRGLADKAKQAMRRIGQGQMPPQDREM